MNKRQMEIMDLLTQDNEVGAQDLAKRFNVSVMTIRRDLSQMESEGALTRTHGGAILSRTRIVEFVFEEKGRACAREKKAIAHEVAKLVQPGMPVVLDTGTTTLEVARAIAGVKNLKVLTTSLPIASILYARENIELVLLGGTVRKGVPDLSGPLTEEALKQFRVSLAILGSDGLSQDGAFTTDVGISRVTRAMMASADKVILAADSSKFESTAFVKYADWSEIDHVVTDSHAPASVRAWLNKAVKEVSYAKVS